MTSIITYVRGTIMMLCLVVIPAAVLSQPHWRSRVAHLVDEVGDRLGESGKPGDAAGGLPGASGGQAIAARGETEIEWQTAGSRFGAPPVHRTALPIKERAPNAADGLPAGVLEADSMPPIAQPAETTTGNEPADVRDGAALARVLQEMGATEYALERWGAAGRLFRFRCVVTVGEGALCRRHFSAIDESELSAITRVVDEVRCWQASTAVR